MTGLGLVLLLLLPVVLCQEETQRCDEMFRAGHVTSVPCLCRTTDNRTSIVVDCDGVAFFGDFPLLPFQQPVHTYTQKNAGVQNLEAQLFTASQVPLKKVDFSHNLLRRLTERLFDGLEGTLEEILLAHNQLGNQLNPIFATAEFQKLGNLRKLDLTSNGLKALDSSLFQGLQKLEELHLEQNEFDGVPTSSLRNLPSLQKLFLQENDISQLDDNSFLDLPNLKVLNLSANSIDSMKGHPFQGIGSLQNLILSHNQLHEISSTVFSTGLSSLQELDLSNNFLGHISTDALSGLQKLSKLVLHSNRIRSLEGAALMELGNLQFLDLCRNGISRIPQNAFAGMQSLKSLYLDYNNLRRLSTDSFFGLEDLELLSIADNQILAFPAEALTEIKNLKKVNLDYNRIAVISSSVLESIQNVEELSLSFNLIKEIPDGTFKKFKNLQLLNLRGNKISEITQSKFEGIDVTLLFLDLGNNDISELGRISFPNLQIISLAENQLNALKDESFELMRELRYVNLSKNTIMEISSNAFQSLNKIIVLDLSDNQIPEISSEVFTNLPLLFINLKNNEIKELGSRMFYKLPNLERIDLGNNQLSSIKNSAFDTLPALKILLLNDNRMSSFKGEMFNGKTSLEIIDLGNNHITYLYPNSFIIHPRLSEIRLGFNKLTFFPTEIISSLKNLQIIDLQSNRLQTLEDADFANMPTLTELWLQNNMISKIGERAFQNSTLLQWLYLQNNNITNLQEKTFRGISRLNLDLSYNNLTGFPSEIFSRMHVFKLESINLASNQFTEFPTASLKRQFSHLEKIDLSSNRISNLPSNADALVNVKELDFSQNPLGHEAHLVLLSEPKSMRKLNIASTGLKFLPLIESPFLTHLNLSGNSISKLERDTFQKTNYLRNLDLSGNQITSLKLMFGHPWLQLPRLKHLNISKNPITSLSTDDFDQVLNIEVLDISNLRDLTKIDCELFNNLKRLESLHFHTFTSLEHLDLKQCLQGKKSFKSLWTEVRDAQLSDQLQNAYSPRLNNLYLTGKNLQSLSSSAFAGLQNPSLHITLSQTSISVLPMAVFLPLPLSTKIQLDIQDNQITTINPQILNILDSKQSQVSITGLQSNPINCDCNMHPLWNWLQEKGGNRHHIDTVKTFGKLSCDQPAHLKNKVISKLHLEELTCSESGPIPVTTTTTTTTRRTTTTKQEPEIIFQVPSTSPKPPRKPVASTSTKHALTKVDTMIIGIVAGVVAFVCILIIIICIIRLRRARPHYTAGPLAGPLALRAQGSCTCLKPPPSTCTCYPPHGQPFTYSTIGRQKMMPPPAPMLAIGGIPGRQPMHLKNTPYYVTYPDSDNENR